MEVVLVGNIHSTINPPTDQTQSMHLWLTNQHRCSSHSVLQLNKSQLFGSSIRPNIARVQSLLLAIFNLFFNNKSCSLSFLSIQKNKNVYMENKIKWFWEERHKRKQTIWSNSLLLFRYFATRNQSNYIFFFFVNFSFILKAQQHKFHSIQPKYISKPKKIQIQHRFVLLS